jgi:hypothetical protein
MSTSGLRRGSQKPHPRREFTTDEDTLLSDLVEKYGADAWQQLSRFMPGRNSRQCRDRWTNFLSPHIIRNPWSPDEEIMLSQKFAEFGHSWKKITACFDGRSEVNVKSHWLLMQRRRERNVIHAAQLRFLGQIVPKVIQEPVFEHEAMTFSNENHGDCDLDPWPGW